MKRALPLNCCAYLYLLRTFRCWQRARRAHDCTTPTIPARPHTTHYHHTYHTAWAFISSHHTPPPACPSWPTLLQTYACLYLPLPEHAHFQDGGGGAGTAGACTHRAVYAYAFVLYREQAGARPTARTRAVYTSRTLTPLPWLAHPVRMLPCHSRRRLFYRSHHSFPTRAPARAPALRAPCVWLRARFAALARSICFIGERRAYIPFRRTPYRLCAFTAHKLLAGHYLPAAHGETINAGRQLPPPVPFLAPRARGRAST